MWAGSTSDFKTHRAVMFEVHEAHLKAKDIFDKKYHLLNPACRRELGVDWGFYPPQSYGGWSKEDYESRIFPLREGD